MHFHDEQSTHPKDSVTTESIDSFGAAAMYIPVSDNDSLLIPTDLSRSLPP